MYCTIGRRAELRGELGPPCRVCERPLRSGEEVLVACTACLRVSHHDCLAPGATCVTPDCALEAAG